MTDKASLIERMRQAKEAFGNNLKGGWLLWKREKSQIAIFNPATGERIASPTSQTYMTFDEALGAFGKGDSDGIGIVLNIQADRHLQRTLGSPCMIAIHNAFSGSELTETASILVKCMNTYCERSPSGKGVTCVFSAGAFPKDDFSDLMSHFNMTFLQPTDGQPIFLPLTGQFLTQRAEGVNRLSHRLHTLREETFPRVQAKAKQPDDTVEETLRDESPSAVEPSRQKRWPDPPSAESFYGLAGDFVRLVQDHSESSPVALLTQFLVGFGNVAGRGAYYQVEADKHYPNEFMVLVGPTGQGRKGTSLGHVLARFEKIQGDWVRNQVMTNVSTGEALVWELRDATRKQVQDKETGQISEVTSDFGVSDKRLLALYSEFSFLLKTMGRRDNTLSEVVRDAWDRGRLSTISKTNPARATGAHLSIIGHITPTELRKLVTETEMANGFANRILWIYAKRSKILPMGGNVSDLDFEEFDARLCQALEFAGAAGRLQFDSDASKLWHEAYPALATPPPGLLGAVISRAAPHVIRLALIYALLDCSTSIGVVHLKAALSIWRYAEASARYIFGDSLGDPIADMLLRALRERKEEGLTQTEIMRDVLKGNYSAGRVEDALLLLEESGMTHREEKPTGKRPAVVWRATC